VREVSIVDARLMASSDEENAPHISVRAVLRLQPKDGTAPRQA
jgi:hypothetical protein